MNLLLNFVSFNYSGVRMCLGVCHRDILAIFSTPSVLNILGSLAHNVKKLKITWDWNKFFVHFKCSCTMVTTSAKWYNVPSLISAVSLLYMCTNQVTPVVTISSTATISLVTGMMVPVVEPRRVACWCGITARAVDIFYVHFFKTTLLCGLLYPYTKSVSKEKGTNDFGI